MCSSHAAVEIEQVSSLFQEKQAELQAAVLRVEQLSLQLEDLRRGKLNGIQSALGGQVTGAAALELRKLYQELQVLCSKKKQTKKKKSSATSVERFYRFNKIYFESSLFCCTEPLHVPGSSSSDSE